MAQGFKVGLVQLTSPRDPQAALDQVAGLVTRAAEAGADFILTPECTNYIVEGARDQFARAVSEEASPTLQALRDLAARHGKWLLIGSLSIRIAEDRVQNRSYLINDAGDIVARYNKIHLFDVDLAGGESYRESKTYKPGDAGVVAATPFGAVGLSICYDLRFPYLYRQYAQAGARFLTVPAAFTRQTGAAHWHTLLRARAIETGTYVFAPAQTGTHESGRQTYGHSLVIDPWGEVIADAGEAPGILLADVDPSAIDTARMRVPSLQHTVEVEVKTS